jgi:23S rRNA (uracil1939-C5)-methyltransferase
MSGIKYPAACCVCAFFAHNKIPRLRRRRRPVHQHRQLAAGYFIEYNMALLDNIITLMVEKPVYGGSGLGFHEHKAILVPFAVPGDTVRVKITDEKKDYCIGVVESCISTEASRIKPACPVFEDCGGCSYLHIPYPEELTIKRRILEDNLVRIAGLSPGSIPEIEILNGQRFNYRSHADFKVSKCRAGFYRKGSNDHIPLPPGGCLLLAEELNTHLIDRVPSPKRFKVALDSSNLAFDSSQSDAIITERAGGFILKRSIDEFFQVNRFLRPAMLERTIGYAALSSNETFLDVGCGVGFFTLPLACEALHGKGIDIRKESIRWAKQNAAFNKVDNVDFAAIPASYIHPVQHRADIVVADPPRAGLDRRTRNALTAMSPRRIVYVSCNPSTFSRDAKDLIKAGYNLEGLTLIDMFPCTHHIEMISLFKSSRT